MQGRTTSFAIMGSGGVEGYLGGRLARAGYPVTLIARGAHLEAIKASGLSAEGSEEAFRVDVPATFDPREIGEVDFVLFSVKLQDTEQAARAYVHLDGDTVAERLAFVGSLPCEVRASMAMSLAQVRRLELPWLSGAVVRLGSELGVDTPANRFIYTALSLPVEGEAARAER
jgi:ketopantoate reductase